MSSFIPINLGGGTLSINNNNNDIDKAYTDKTYVNESGDAMRGNLNMGPHRLIVAEPTYPNDAVNMVFMENSITKFKEEHSMIIKLKEKELKEELARIVSEIKNQNSIIMIIKLKEEELKKEIKNQNLMIIEFKEEIKVLREEVKKPNSKP